jgi:hypothetical protein
VSLEGIPGLSPALRSFVAMVRDYHRDEPALNRLIDGQETSDRQICWYVKLALSQFNGKPPHIGAFTLEQLIARDQTALLLQMVTVILLESVGLLQTRNHLNYSDGGLSIGSNDKTPLIQSWLKYYKSSIEQELGATKISFNIAQVLGSENVGMHSEYWALHAVYTPW